VNIPDLCVPDLPPDPTEWLPLLRRLNLFETASYTGEDSRRTAQYQEETQRRQLRTSFADEGTFLASLDMVGTVEGFTSYNIPRVAKLTQRSNQFNLRTIRYDESQIERMVASERHHCFALSLEDRFGSNGLISVLIAEQRGDELFIDTWLMSCRVLKRGVEQLALNTLAAAARRGGAKRLVGEYIRTAKNELVQHHYRSLGFTEHEGRWVLEVSAFDELPHHIRLGATT
jgi:FkbH-like protein